MDETKLQPGMDIVGLSADVKFDHVAQLRAARSTIFAFPSGGVPN